MRVIILTQGQHTVVDDDTYEWASQFNWHAHPSDRACYAARWVPQIPGQKRVRLFLHREILKIAPGLYADHIDGDGLNNLTANLRACRQEENRRNRRKDLDNSSGYKGVSFHKRIGKWQAQINAGGRRHHLGYFSNLVDAALAYDKHALGLHGRFAHLNFPIAGGAT